MVKPSVNTQEEKVTGELCSYKMLQMGVGCMFIQVLITGGRMCVHTLSYHERHRGSYKRYGGYVTKEGGDLYIWGFTIGDGKACSNMVVSEDMVMYVHTGPYKRDW